MVAKQKKHLPIRKGETADEYLKRLIDSGRVSIESFDNSAWFDVVEAQAKKEKRKETQT